MPRSVDDSEFWRIRLRLKNKIQRADDMTFLKSSPWDSAELLDSPEAIAAYIEAAFEDGDPSLIAHALGVVARSRGMSQLAKDAGLSRDALYKAFQPDGNPTLQTLSSVMKALGMKLTVQTQEVPKA